MNDSKSQAQFYLAEWHVDTDTNYLSNDKTRVKLESKVMSVLHYLVMHQNEMVTRESLEQAIWGDTVVGYDALTRCIAQLRKALNDNSRAPRYIETISKKGYRLIAPVSEHTQSQNNSDKASKSHSKANHFSFKKHGQTWLIGFAAVILLLASTSFLLFKPLDHSPAKAIAEKSSKRLSHRQPSIVVLPFSNLHQSGEQDYFSDGMTADITTELSKLSGLLVISNSSAMGYQGMGYQSMGYQGKTAEIKQIAESLAVRYVLEGSVRRTQNRIRINVNLIDSASEVYLWSEKYDRELRSVFDVQDDITTNIIRTLSIKLTEQEKRRTAQQYTNSINAYDDFLHGQAYYFRLSQEDNLIARNYFQQAIVRDESFARAYSAMALTYVAEHRYAWEKRSRMQLDEALKLASKGSSLDPELPQAYWVLGYVHLFRREFSEAADAASRAIELDPNYADSYLTLAICNIHRGKPDIAVTLVQKAMLLNPQYPAAYASILGQSYFYNGEYERAVPVLHEAIERNNNLLTAYIFLISSLSKLQQLDEAEWVAVQLKTLSTDFSANQLEKMLANNNYSSIEDIKMQLQRAGL